MKTKAKAPRTKVVKVFVPHYIEKCWRVFLRVKMKLFKVLNLILKLKRISQNVALTIIDIHFFSQLFYVAQ